MKNWKKLNVLGIVIVLTMAIGFVGCGSDANDQEKPEQAKPQEKVINFGDGLKAKVTGNMTDSQWAIAIPKIETALNAVVTNGGEPAAFCNALFGTLGASIELVSTKEYDYYKVDLSVVKFFLNASYVISATPDDLLQKITAMINATDDKAPIQAKAVPVRDGLCWFVFTPCASAKIRVNLL